MPKLDLTVSPGALSPQAKRDLPRQLAAVMLKWEGAPDSRFARSIAWVHVHELAEGAVHDGDGPTDEPHLILETTVPAGVLSERRRAGLIAEATETIRAAAGLARADSIWVIVHEVPDGHWGSAGEVVRLENLRAAVMRAGAPVSSQLVRCGLSPVAALAAATSVAATACRVDGRTGRLRAGLSADLLLVDGDPMTDITALGRPRMVISRGRVAYR